MKTILMVLCFAAIPATAADVTGSWKIEGNLGGNVVNLSCSLRHSGTRLVGKCTTSANYTSDVAGATEGNNVNLRYNLDINGASVTLVFTGVLESESVIKGTVSAQGLGQSPFTAMKQ